MYKLVSFIGQDDADILGPFLTHYRKLGVGEFHLIIHGTWAAADLAPLRSKDVKIAGVAQDPFDVVMKTSTIEDYATTLSGGWLIVVDADEFLELPYASLNQMTATLDRIGVEELPALLLQRAAADGSLPTLPDRASLDAVFPCYDYLLAERMNVPFPIWKSKYPLVRFGPQSRLSRGHHLPSTGRPSAHVPIRGILHHFKWRDRLLRSISRIRGESSNQREQDAYRFWLEAHEFRLPTVGLKPYSRSALFQDGHLVGPTRPELSRLSALQKARRAPWALHGNTASALRTLRYVLPAAAQDDKRASSYLDRVGLLARPGKIALVTSDILGMRRTGGIGTAVAALAERLAGAGHEVHVYLSPFAGFPTLAPVWFRYWEARGVRIRQFSRRDAKGRITTTEQMSLILSRALAEDSWDVIHFPDAGGMGAATLLLRAAGLAFEGTQIAVTVHGPTRWHRGGNLLPWNSTEAESTHLGHPGQ
jgi:hypothetical protein